MPSESRPAMVTDIYPLSPVQQGLLFHTLSAPDSGVYFEQFSLRLEGTLDTEAFRVAWRRMIQRHDVLRAAVEWEGVDDPLMVVLDDVDLPWTDHDWRGLDETEQTERLAAALARQRTEGFDLSRPPLMRVELIRLTDSAWQLVWHYHHLVLDGWSSAALLRELFLTYLALCEGIAPTLPDARPYRDYIGWLRNQDPQAAERYWRALLSGLSEPTALGVDRPGDGFRGDDDYDRRELVLPADLTARLAEVARERRLTTSTIFHAAWSLLLSRYSGSDDVVFGVTSSGRPTDLAGAQDIAGMFINTLPARVRVPRDQCVGDWLAELQRVETERRQFEFSSLAKVQEWCDLPSGVPLFDSILVVENYPMDFSAFEAVHDLEVTDVFAVEQTNYPLTVLIALGEQVTLKVWFDDTRVAAVAAERVLTHLRWLIEELIGDPHRTVAGLGLLSEAERRQMDRWADTATAFGEPECLHEPVARQAAATPHAVAVRCAEEELTYAELDRRANQLAHFLVRQGVRADRVVGVCMHRSVDLVVAMIGVLKAGGAYVPLDPDHPVDRLDFMLRDTDAVLVLTQESLRAGLPATVPTVAVDTEWDALVANGPDTPPQRASAPTDLAYVMYTSGSTGNPKGVMVQHDGVWNRLEWGQHQYRLDESDVVLQKTPYTFDVSVWEFFWPLMVGARLVLARTEGHKDPDYLVRLIAAESITIVHFVPSMLRYFLAADGVGELRSLEKVFCSGEALTGDLRDRLFDLLDAELHNLFGPTEASIEVTQWQCLPAHRGDPVVPIGRPIANVTCRILDQAGQQVPVGVPGELCLGGVGVARGYLGLPGLTGEKFIDDPFGDGRLYRTGDRARWRADGVIEFLGRTDDQVKIRGQRVEPGEIESVILTCPSVRDAAVTVHEVDGQRRLAAYVVAVDTVDIDEVREWVLKRLPEYMVPAGITVLDRLPLSANGKLDRRSLPDPVWQDREEFLPARSTTEEELAGIWVEVLGVERVGVLDNFFALGGDSILSIQIVSRAAQQGIHFTPAQVFREQTIARLAEVAGHGPVVVARQEPVTGPVTLGPVQRWFFRLGLAVPDQWNQGVVLTSRTGLEPDLVRAALGDVLTQHDVLRSRFVDGNQHQEGVEHVDVPVDVLDGTVDDAVRTAHSGLNLSTGPLLRAAIADGRLVIACHHLVVDAVSWRFILEDFERAYASRAMGQPARLPAKTTPFAEWTARLRDHATSEHVTGQAEYWREVLRDSTSLPVGAGEAVRSLSLPAEVTSRLAGNARVMKARLDELVLTACARGLTEWGDDPGVTIDVEGHGREPLFDDIDHSRTVGWFTVMRPVRLPVGGMTEVDAVREVKKALRSAPDNGIGYGLLREFTDLIADSGEAAVLFNFLGQLDAPRESLFALEMTGAEGARAPENASHHAVEINAAVHGNQLTVQVTGSADADIDALVAAIRRGLDALTVPHNDVTRAYLPTDFPFAGITVSDLTRITETRGPVADLYPATAMQQGLLFHTLAAPSSGMYFEQFSVQLDGDLDAGAFRAAWERLLDRHEALRSSVVWEGLDAPLVVVHDNVELPWTHEDWRGLADTEQSDRLTALLAGQRADGFDLSRAPLIRVALFRLADSAWQVVWNYHHLILDGWSSANVLGELFEIYVSLAGGREPSLPPARQYRDYVDWLRGQDLRTAELYWRGLLEGVTEPTALGVDRLADVARRDEDYGRREVQLPAELCDRLATAARRRRLTVNTLFQAAWSLLLSRYSGSDDVVFGVTSSGRPVELAGVERIAGLFINTLPARIDCSPGRELGPWLNELQQAQIDQRQFEFTPLTKVGEWSPVPAGTPLFESILVFENYPADFSVLDEISSIRVAGLHSMEQTNYPLTVVIIPGSRVTVKVWFDQNRIEAAAAERLLDHLAGVLHELTGDVDRTLGEIGLLTAAEVDLYETWADTTADLGQPERLHRAIARQAAATPAAVAVRCEGEELTYVELDHRANQVAHRLRSHGVTADRVVGVCMHRSVDLVVALLGVLKAGGAYVPLDPEYPTARLEFILRDTGANVVLTQDELRGSLPGGVAVLTVDEVADEPSTAPEHVGTPSDLAYVIYTSGSTGAPKGVMTEHRGAWNRLRWMQAEYPIGGSDVVLQKTPYTFDVSVWEFFWPLMVGARLVLARPDGHRDPDYLVDLIRAEQVTTLHFVPSMLRYFLAAEGVRDLDSVRRVFSSGEALTSDLRDRFFDLLDAELHNLFGPTEASIDVTYWQCLPEHAGDPVVPIGRPIANTTCRILDRAGLQTPVGVPGELHLGGIGLARGYLGRPELTAERFVDSPFAEGRLYRTGDRARWRADGVIEFLGRTDDQVKIRGLRVEPGEIEAVLRDDDVVKHAAVVVERREDGDGMLAAFVESDFAEVGDQSSTPWRRQHVEHWQSLYEQIYAEPAVDMGADFNTAGWLSSYTGAPIPAVEMLEWRDRTVERILGLRPRRVLEIGCGTGILLTRIAPRTAHYHGTDTSRTALDHVRGLGIPHVVLERREAVDFAAIEPGSFDTVVINSVAQYFPDLAYLTEVLRGAVDTLAPGGKLFVGDVRSLLMLETLHASVQAAQASGDVLARDVRERVRQLARIENELVVDPRYFHRLREEVPGVGRVEISVKEGGYDNELSRFRYDVVLEKGRHNPVDARWTHWSDAAEGMVRSGAKELITFARVPNARVRRHHELWRRLLAAADDQTFAEAVDGETTEGVDPEQLRALGRSRGYDVEISWASGYGDGAFDAILSRTGRPRPDFRPPHDDRPAELANMPTRQELAADLGDRLLAKLARTLPSYQVPSALTVVDAMPMTSSGKVDRKALRAMRSQRSEKPYVAPRDVVELALARTWEKILGAERVGVLDDFFELGGDSLVAIRLVTEVRNQFGTRLTLADQLTARTVAEVAELIRGERGGAEWRPLVRITPGDGIPIFCVHPAGGSVLCYGELARRLGRAQPVYGLAPLGLEEGQVADDSVTVMVERYLAEVRTVRPHGPYHLAGWSLGGVVALEMATRLKADGEDVLLVAMIDSVAPDLVDDDVDDIDVLAEFFAEVPLDLEHLRSLDPDEAVRVAMDQAAAVDALPVGLDADRLLRMREVHKRHINALACHRPTRYEGDVVLFRAMDTPVPQPAYGWERTVNGRLDVVGVPGNHQTVLVAPGVGRIARELTARVASR